jgi:sulfatase maturation enzyme AslB (radical SAM superfamily)
MELNGFCAAPWIEGVVLHDGVLRTCCRNGTVFADWQKLGLQEGWHSEKFMNFRQSIVEGKFPDNACKNCYHNGTARSLDSDLTGPFGVYSQIIFDFFNKKHPEIENLRSQFTLRQADSHSDNVLTQYFSALQELEAQSFSYPLEVQQALNKLSVIGRVAKAFLKGELKPPIVAPFRQVQLVAKCNARCIQCPGLYTGEIINGQGLDENYIDEAFSQVENIFDFFMMGSEFLVYKRWKKIADHLVSNGVKLSISTNSIRLIPENIRYLIDNQVVRALNISMDGATKKTVESIRVKVKFDELVEKIAFLCRYATEKKYDFNLGISFVLMKRNYHEFPQLVRLIHQLRGDNPLPRIHVYCQSLENYGEPEEYINFVTREHHTLVDRTKLVAVFEDTLKASQSTGIPVRAFYTHKLEDFIKQGCPFPPLSITKVTPVTLVPPISYRKSAKHINISPTLEHQATITPLTYVITVANEEKSNVTVSPILVVPQWDQGKQVKLFASIVIGDDVYIATDGGPFGFVNWVHHTVPLEQIMRQEKISSFAKSTLGQWQNFNLGLHHIDLSELSGIVDIYYGYAATPILSAKNSSEFVGASYRVVFS